MSLPHKKTIILLHGAIGAQDQLGALKTLLDNNLEVYTLNFSGHGRKPFSDAFGIAKFAEDLISFIENHNLIQPHIFGYSMGGYVALYLSIKHKNLLGNIITLGTKFDWTNESAEKESRMLNPETILNKVPKFAEALMQRHGEENWKIVLKKTAEMMHELGQNNLLNASNFQLIENRVLIGLADQDNMVSYKETRAVFEALPNAGMYMLPQSKHPIEQINTRLLSKVICNFLE